MKELIGYCGLDCEKCEARIATINNDEELKNKVAKQWSLLNNVTITKDMINCVGCRVKGVKTPFCDNMCEIRKCAISKTYETCKSCKIKNTCTNLKEIIDNSDEAKSNLQIKK